jgi:GNAT superfamily N-acetyltransferase
MVSAMKNPMDRDLEKRLSQRAVAIGREGEAAAFDELLELLESSSANVRRLAASALGKLAWLGVDQGRAVAALAPVALKDGHAQTRQYAIKALKAYGAAVAEWLQDLRDIAANGAEKDYLRRDAQAASASIEEAIRIAADASVQWCQRCHAVISAEEHARSRQVFQRTFCDRCFDETFLTRRNFETDVELAKTVHAADGTVVQSRGERIVAEWLSAHGIAYRYDAKYRIIGEFQIRPDFFLPELDVYIEYWGMNTPQYKMSMYKKQTLYQQEGKRLVSIHPRDLTDLDGHLAAKLSVFGYTIQPSASAAQRGADIAVMTAADVASVRATFRKPDGYYEGVLSAQERGELVVLVARREGGVRGYLKVVWRSEYSPFRDAEVPEIQDLNVRPACRRQGVATRLMDRAELLIAERAQIAGIGVGLHPGYGAAQRMYAQRGYVPDARPLTWRLAPVSEGQTVTLDDDLVLHLTKDLQTT